MSDARFQDESSESRPIKPGLKETTVRNISEKAEDTVPTAQTNRKDEVPEPLISEIEVQLSDEHLSKQREAIQSEFGLKEYEADILYDAIKNLVREQANELNKDWSKEAVESVANLVAAMMIQEEKQRPESVRS